MLRSVDMARKSDSILAHFRKRRQAHHLIATAVSQYWTPLSHEIVQSAQPIDLFRTGAKHTMISVSQDVFRAVLLPLLRPTLLSSCCGFDRHEGKCADIAPLHRARAGLRFVVCRGN